MKVSVSFGTVTEENKDRRFLFFSTIYISVELSGIWYEVGILHNIVNTCALGYQQSTQATLNY